uniref:OAR domain-containing protein n=1 Tax=Heterorhabditis bacteriophora TaxID=37862 RepID=A0A1I7XHD2_HETBA
MISTLHGADDRARPTSTTGGYATASCQSLHFVDTHFLLSLTSIPDTEYCNPPTHNLPNTVSHSTKMAYNVNSAAAAAFAYAHLPCPSTTTPGQGFSYNMTTVPAMTMFPTAGYNAGEHGKRENLRNLV